jgi:hypothetical protein
MLFRKLTDPAGDDRLGGQQDKHVR